MWHYAVKSQFLVLLKSTLHIHGKCHDLVAVSEASGRGAARGWPIRPTSSPLWAVRFPYSARQAPSEGPWSL